MVLARGGVLQEERSEGVQRGLGHGRAYEQEDQGVILDNDEPHVIGCIRITQLSKVEVFKTIDATNSQTSQTSQATVRPVWTRCIRT